MKFTKNWRACYGTIEHRLEIAYMREGATAEAALQHLLERPIDVFEINKCMKDDFYCSDEELAEDAFTD